MKPNAIQRYISLVTASQQVDGDSFTKSLHSAANAFVRQHHHHSATSIILSPNLQPFEFKIMATTKRGYRKKSDGQYVPNKYLSNFGWKNTYYQSAEVEVHVGITPEQKQAMSLNQF